ncbi:MAG TPA: hypothetical protein VM870_09800 [Pyrinomonadaceae bacterium]|nr:hypothetical protein [Pyrinomonadaceae bacterium]
MCRLFLIALFIAAAFGAGAAQESIVSLTPEQDLARLAVAPKEMNGIGRLVVNIVDGDGQPIKGAFAKLDSHRTDGFLCESWASTNSFGLAALPPIHMGKLKLKVKAKGYHDQVVELPLDQLSEAVKVTLKKK